MPIPKPRDGESKSEFLARCMGDETMKAEFPDEDQRLAVCGEAWNAARRGDESDLERRVLVTDVELEEREGKAPVIRGYAALFNVLSEDLGGFREMIRPGAFKRAIAEDDVRAVFNHDPNLVLGRNKAKTLRLQEDRRGLAIEIDPPDTQVARDLMTSMRRGDVDQMSFAFRVRKGGQRWVEENDDDNRPTIIRTLTDVQLFDVSPVTYAAYPQTTVAVRDLLTYLEQKSVASDLRAAERARVELMRLRLQLEA